MFKNMRPLLFSSLAAAFILGLAACDSDPGGPDPTVDPDANANPPMNDQGSPDGGGGFNESNPSANTGGYDTDSPTGDPDGFNEGDPPTSSGGYDQSSQPGSGDS